MLLTQHAASYYASGGAVRGPQRTKGMLVVRFVLCALAALTRAHALRFVENEMPVPRMFSDALYGVEYLDTPVPGIESAPSSHVVDVLFRGEPFRCALPMHTLSNVEPVLNNTDAIAQAQSEVQKWGRHIFTLFDDVWGWRFELDNGIFQFLPKRMYENGGLQVKLGTAYTTVGRVLNTTGHNLNSTQPRLVGDRFMMRAVFDKGSVCDLSQLPRVAYLYFACDPDAPENDVRVLSATEPESNCKYEFVLGIRGLCAIPEFAASHSTINRVRCGPAQARAEPEKVDPSTSMDTEPSVVDIDSIPILDHNSGAPEEIEEGREE